LWEGLVAEKESITGAGVSETSAPNEGSALDSALGSASGAFVSAGKITFGSFFFLIVMPLV
jgi:hypothetical protein